MSYENKLERIRALIAEFNSAASVSGVRTIVANEVFEKITALGAINEATASMLTWEDLESCGLPRVIAKSAGRILRESEQVEPEAPTHVSEKRASRMSFEELFLAYRAEPGHEDAVTRKLKELTGGKRCVVFLDEVARTVNVSASVQLLKEIKRGLPEMSVLLCANKDGSRTATRVYKIGEIPDDELDQNPLYPGRALRTDETCDQTLRSWKGVPVRLRQLVFLALTKTKELTISSVSDAHNAMDLCVGEDAEMKLEMRFSRAVILLHSLKRKGDEPRLKLLPSQISGGSDPFYR